MPKSEEDNVVAISDNAAILRQLRQLVVERSHEVNTNTDGAKQPMATDREYVDLKLEAAEARTEARFAELNGKLDRVADNLSAIAMQVSDSRSEIRDVRSEARADNKSTRNTILATALASVLALGALFISMITYGDAIFSRGMSVRDVVSAAVKEQADKSQPAPAASNGKQSGAPSSR